MNQRRALGRAVLLSSILSLIFIFSGLASAQDATVTGTVTYLQRIALPPDAVVKVTLEDVSLADAPAKVLAQKETPTAGKQVPIPFELMHSPADVPPSHRYSVRATIKVDGKLLFTSTTSYPVLTSGVASEVKIVVHPLFSTSTVTESGDPAASFAGTDWTLTELAGLTPPAIGPQTAYLQFTTEGNRVRGSTGCNRLTGSYEKNGSMLKFHPIASTMMACIGPTMETENKFNNALGRTISYRIRGNTFVLLSEKSGGDKV